MKLIITILILISSYANATNYYISNTGSDGAAGTSVGAAWQTIAKVNASSFSPGDSILFKCGDTWNERLNFPSSGTTGNPIIISSYGSGLKPLITGFQSLTMSDAGGNIWSATATNSVKNLNTVLVNGLIKAKSRYPATGTTLDNLTHTGDTLITSDLTGTPDYTGAEIVLRTWRWIWDVSKILSQSTGTLKFRPVSSPPNNHFGFFIQNILPTVAGSWQYDSATKVLKVYATSSPTVYYSSIDTLLNIASKNYINIIGLQFAGANKAAIEIDNSSYINISNCTFNNSGTNAITVYSSPNVSATYDTVMNSLNNGMYFRNLNYANIQFNYIKNSGIYAGMGSSGEGMYNGIYAGGLDSFNVCSNNRIDSSGYNGIMFFSYHGRVEKNYVTNFCYIKDDGGGIYAGWDSTVIRHNIVSGGIGAPYYGEYNICGHDCLKFIAAGIYLDGTNYYCVVDSNTVFNCYYSAIVMASGHHYYFNDNTVVDSNNSNGRLFLNTASRQYTTALRNVFYEKSVAPLFIINVDATNNIDYNTWLRFIEHYYVNRFNNAYNFDDYQIITGYDAHGTDTLTGITTDEGVLYINPSLSTVVIPLADTAISAKGVTYASSVTLAPYSSELLFTADGSVPPIPPPPVITGDRLRKIRFKTFKQI